MSNNEPVKISVNYNTTVKSHRAHLTKFGSLYGKVIWKAVRRPGIANFSKIKRLAEESNDLTFSRCPENYVAIPVNITAICLGQEVDGSISVILNKDMEDDKHNSLEIHCPIDNPNVAGKVTTENVIRACNDSNGGNIYFSSARELIKALNESNAKEISRLRNLMDNARDIINGLNIIVDQNINNVEDYYKELDGVDLPKVETKIEING